MIRNVNTIEEYKNLDKTAVLNRAGRTVSAVRRITSLGLTSFRRYGTP